MGACHCTDLESVDSVESIEYTTPIEVSDRVTLQKSCSPELVYHIIHVFDCITQSRSYFAFLPLSYIIFYGRSHTTYILLKDRHINTIFSSRITSNPRFNELSMIGCPMEDDSGVERRNIVTEDEGLGPS